MKRIIAIIAAAMAVLATAPGAFAATDYLKIPDKLDFGTKTVGTENYKGVSVKNRTSSDIDVYVTSALPDDFGFGLMPGSTCPALGPTLKNKSSLTLHVSIDSWASDDISPGQPESTCPLSHTLNVLAPGQSCTHVVGFQPSEFFRNEQTAQLNIRVFAESGEVLETRQVKITGKGV